MPRWRLLASISLPLVLGLALACAQARTSTPTPSPTVVKTFPTPVPTSTSTPVATPTPAAATTPAASDAAAGNTIFTARCDFCHPGGKKGVGSDLTGIASTQTDAQISATIRNGRGAMPPFSLSDKELADLLAYLKTLR